ncbi:uncharacterized protein ARMOST_21422 [Armillaria ostoyae]|uniref:Uncharacterized protein n=1 Tax=Armillaria ostoyae TaxID=47428 RepID=A0A284SA12_ARMOS|nr:uncharacterized protein ARMOST_21422 [Armillaria ostoyae]
MACHQNSAGEDTVVTGSTQGKRSKMLTPLSTNSVAGLRARYPSSVSTTDITQPDGTLNVTFPPPAGEYAIEGVDGNGFGVAFVSQIFDVADDNSGGASNSEALSSSTAVQSASTTLLPSFMSVSREPYSSSAKSVQSTATTPPDRNRNSKHRLSPNLKIIPDLNSHSPPVGNKNGETITPMLVDGAAPDLGDRSQEIVEQNPEGNPTRDEGERRPRVGTPVHVDNSELQVAPQREAALDVVAEVVRLRTQVQQIIVEREAERFHGNALDPPPAYA